MQLLSDLASKRAHHAGQAVIRKSRFEVLLETRLAWPLSRTSEPTVETVMEAFCNNRPPDVYGAALLEQFSVFAAIARKNVSSSMTMVMKRPRMTSGSACAGGMSSLNWNLEQRWA